MVTPDRRRVAVERLCERFGVSKRRACAVVGQHLATQHRPKAAPSRAEAELREHLRDFARCHRRLGWRKAHAVAHREGLVTNPKRTQRIWHDERLQRPPQRKAERRRLADGTAARLRAQRPNDVCALDFQFDETADLRRIKLLNIVDEFTREALAVEAAHSIDADITTADAATAAERAPLLTTFHLEDEVIEEIDREAAALRCSRSRYVELLLEAAAEPAGTGCSPA